MKHRHTGWFLTTIALFVCGAGFLWLQYCSAVRQKHRNMALLAAIKHYDTGRVIALLKEGADPNIRDNPADLTVWHYLHGLLDHLRGKPLQSIGDPTALQVVFDSAIIPSRPNQPLAPQIVSMRPEPVAIIQELLAKGAKVNVNESDMPGWPLILYPAQHGWADSVRMMLDKGADCNARAANGATVLSFAVNSKNARLVKLLLERGANVNTRDGQGTTLLADAATFSTPEIIALLKQAGAK